MSNRSCGVGGEVETRVGTAGTTARETGCAALPVGAAATITVEVTPRRSAWGSSVPQQQPISNRGPSAGWQWSFRAPIASLPAQRHGVAHPATSARTRAAAAARPRTVGTAIESCDHGVRSLSRRTPLSSEPAVRLRWPPPGALSEWRGRARPHARVGLVCWPRCPLPRRARPVERGTLSSRLTRTRRVSASSRRWARAGSARRRVAPCASRLRAGPNRPGAASRTAATS